MSLAHDLCWTSVETIVSRFGCTELHGAETPERLPLTAEMMHDNKVGEMRVWRTPDVIDVVYVGLTVPVIGLDSHMMFAFSPPGSPVPHFTLDSVMNDPQFAFHLDLIPQVDLGAHLAYMDHCFGPLTELLEAGEAIEGLEPARLSPRQYAIMSPWMFVHRANEAAFAAIGSTVDAYRDHWASLVEAGVPTDVLDGLSADDLAARDRANRAIIFDPDVDPVWDRVTQLVGAEQSDLVRGTLAHPLE